MILARLQTRDKADFRKKYFHHFYGPNLVKILFHVLNLADRQILQSRYHQEYPITPKNPLTNQVIVGEVDFFVLHAEELSMTCQKVESSSEEGTQVEWQHASVYKAEYFGSDFNYATQ